MTRTGARGAAAAAPVLACAVAWALALVGALPASAQLGSGHDLQPWALFREPEILRVSVSPSGEWVAALAHHEDIWGVLVQRRGVHGTVPVYGSNGLIRSIDWTGGSTLFVTNDASDRVKAVALRFRFEDGELLHDALEIKRSGGLVAPLVDAEDEILWAEGEKVYRTSLSAFAPSLKKSAWAPGERVLVAEQADVYGNWVADHAGVVRAVITREGRYAPEYVLRYRQDAGVFTFRDMELVCERFHFDLASFCEGLELPLDAVSERLAAVRMMYAA